MQEKEELCILFKMRSSFFMHLNSYYFCNINISLCKFRTQNIHIILFCPFSIPQNRFFIFYGGKVKLPAFFNTQKAQLPL
ncbi:hypothetical protein, partial [Staphylococcus aureus]